MRTWWAWIPALALCATPALAQARERGHDRGNDGRGHSAAQERHPAAGGHSARDSNRDRGGRGAYQRSDPGGRGAYQRSNPGARGAWHSGGDNRAIRREDAPPPAPRYSAPRYSTGRDYSRRDSSRPADGRYSQRGNWGHENRGSWGRSDGYRHDDHGWRGSYGYGRYHGHAYAYRRGYYRPYYAYGYFYGHGYYFPRYYFDLEEYPAYGAIRTLVGPDQTEVYVDGYYAGVADDFDGLFQRLRVAPGTHEITLRLDGFLTWTAEVFAAPGQTIDLHHDMVPGASEPGPGMGPDPRYGQPGDYGQPGGDEPPPGDYEYSGPPPPNE